MRVIKKKLKSRIGFSLAETLIAILILLMVSAIVGAAIPAASRVYVDTVDAANAQLLLSTATNALRDKLSTATSPEAKDGTIITFKTRTTVNGKNADAWCMIKMDMDGGTLKIYYGSQDAAHQAETSKYGITSYDLVSKEAKTENLSVIYTSVACNNGVVTFTGLRVTKAGVASPLAGPCDVSVRTLS